MPVPVGLGLPPIIPAPDREPSDAYTATWIAPDGSIWPLTSPELGWHTLDGPVGLGAAPVDLTVDDYALGGGIVRHTQPLVRYITWPLRVRGDHHGEFIVRWRALMLAFTQTRRRGPGTLQIRRPDGTVRQIRARYQAGFDTSSPGNLAGYRHDTAVLTLLCEDPYWEALDPFTISREFEGSDDDFLDPFPSVSSAQTLGDTTAVNPGDVEAYPTWLITGPASLITATNTVTVIDQFGEPSTVVKTFSIDPNAAGLSGGGDLGLGDTVTITTRPPTVRGPAGQKWTGAVNYPTAELWALEPGENAINITINDSDTGTSVSMEFRPRYESA